MTEIMRAAVLVEPGKFVLEQRPVPMPLDTEVLIKITHCCICGTDMHIFYGNYAREHLPMVLGHEFTGIIAGMGEAVTRFSIGQRVVVDMNLGCGDCYWCRRNEILNCASMNQIGITMDGGFCDYLCVPQNKVIATSHSVPANVFALTEPLACVVRSARKAGIGFGQSVVVIGAGPIGHLHVQLLRLIGVAPIIVADISQSRVEKALAVGADVGVSDIAELAKEVHKATDGRGVDIVIESVGKLELYQLAQKLLRKGGHLVFFGLTDVQAYLSFNILETILHENSMNGSVAGMGEDMHDALTMLTYGRIDTTYLLTTTYSLEQIQQAFDTHANRSEDLKTQLIL